MPLGPTLTYTTAKLKNLRNRVEANQCIDVNMCNYKNLHTHHDLPQAYKGSKSICLVWIRPTGNLQSHLRTSFSINEHWSNTYDTNKSTINKRRLEQRTWRIYYINHNKTPKNNTWWIDNQINKNNLYQFNCSSRNQ